MWTWLRGGDSDGTRERPWTLIGYALSEVQDGGRVVLAAGEYDSGILFSKSFELVGRCASMVSIMGVRSGFGATVLEAKGAVDIAVSDVRVAGPGMGAVIRGATANLDGSGSRESRGGPAGDRSGDHSDRERGADRGDGDLL